MAAERYYTCPWALARQAWPMVEGAGRVRDGLLTLAEHVGGRPTAAACEAVQIIEAERDLARAVLRAEAGEGTT